MAIKAYSKSLSVFEVKTGLDGGLRTESPVKTIKMSKEELENYLNSMSSREVKYVK